MRVLAEAGGYALYEHDGRLVFVDRGTGWTFWLRFVLGLVTFIVGLNGIAQIALGIAGKGLVLLGVVLLLVAVVAGGAFVAVLVWARSRSRRPLTDFTPLVVVDLRHGVLVGPSGETLAPLGQVTFTRDLQLTSSAPAVACRWPGGKKTVYRGSALGLRGVDDALHALRGVGLHA